MIMLIAWTVGVIWSIIDAARFGPSDINCLAVTGPLLMLRWIYLIAKAEELEK